MNTANPAESPLDELVSEELSGVAFVQDYVQLLFGTPPTLNAYTPITVRSELGVSGSGDPGFADALVAQLNKVVSKIEKSELRKLELIFGDGSSIEISLRPEDYRSPEAFEYFGKRGTIVVE